MRSRQKLQEVTEKGAVYGKGIVYSDVLSNNLANADTNGYKKEGTTSQTFADELAIKIKDTSSYGLAQKLGTISMGVHIGETYTDYSTGSFKVTDNSTDLQSREMDFLRLPTRISREIHP